MLNCIINETGKRFTSPTMVTPQGAIKPTGMTIYYDYHKWVEASKGNPKAKRYIDGSGNLRYIILP